MLVTLDTDALCACKILQVCFMAAIMRCKKFLKISLGFHSVLTVDYVFKFHASNLLFNSLPLIG